MKRISAMTAGVAILAVVIGTPGCGGNHREAASTERAPEAAVEEGEHAEAPEKSDLDKPVAELLAETCEHGIRTYECDECRYEVGVVKVAPELIEQGLVSTVDVTQRAFGASLVLNGEVSFDERLIARVSPPVAGLVSSVLVTRGQHVKKGQPLVEMDSLAYSESTAEYLSAAAAADAASKAFDREKALWERKITSEKDFLEASAALDAAKIRLQSARLGLNGIGLSENDARRAAGARRNKMNLRAPVDGDIFEINVVIGQMLQPGVDAVVMGPRERLTVWTDLYEHQLAPVVSAIGAGGIPVDVSVAAWPDRTFAGRIDFVDGVMDHTSRTVKARVAVDNPDHLLMPGMFATVRPVLAAGEAGLAVPQNAVLSDEGRQFVFVHHDGPWYIRRPVTTGRTDGSFVEVTSGLAAGQQVAANGAFLLKSDVLRSKMGAGCAD